MQAGRKSMLGCAIVLAMACVGRAAEVPWDASDTPIFKIAQDQPLAELFREFAADQGIPATVSTQIGDTISGQFGPLPPREFLDSVTRSNGVIWYYDGHALFFYRSDELVSDMLQVRSMTPAEILEKLRRLELLSDRFKIKTLPEHGLLYISGPPRYLEVVRQAVESIENTSDAQVRIQMAIEVFPLRYAWAEDQTFVFSGQQVIVPGVASILRAIVTGGAGGATGTQIGPLPVNNLPGLSGLGLKRRQNLAIGQAQQIAVDAQISAAQARTRVNDLEQYSLRAKDKDEEIDPLSIQVPAAVQADTRLNAVIVRDARAKMEHYKRIIADLDRPSGLVHLEASIVDIAADAGFEFGPPYVVEWDAGGTQRSAALQINNTQAGTIDPRSLVGNFQFRLLDDTVNQVLAQFQALETDGRARFVARPSVLTINNVEAHLETTSTFFVRVASLEDVDLFDVTTGTMLRIVPHIVCEPTGRRVKLIIRVEDGQATPNETVDGIPTISRNTLNTQAVLNEGESLLIGGLIREEVTKTENRVPLLGRCPGIGTLFTRINSQKQTFDRMVLIRPRIVDLPPPGVHVNAGLEPVAGCQPVPEGVMCPPENLAAQTPAMEYESTLGPVFEPFDTASGEHVPTPVPVPAATPVPAAEPPPVAEPMPTDAAVPAVEPPTIAEPAPVPAAEPPPVAEPTPVPAVEPPPVAEPTPVPTVEPPPVAEPTPVPTAGPPPIALPVPTAGPLPVVAPVPAFGPPPVPTAGPPPTPVPAVGPPVIGPPAFRPH